MTLELLESRRLLSAGDVDTSFGNNGIVMQTYAHGGATINDMIDIGGGKFMAAGLIPIRSHHEDGYRVYYLQRFFNNGTLDTSFGDNGTVTGNFILQSDITDIALMPDGRIAAIVYENNGNKATEYHLVAMFNADGSVDTTWGEHGYQIITTDKHDRDGNFALAVQGDLKVLVGWENAVRRYDGFGALDDTFGNHGEVDNVLPPTGYSKALLVQLSTGKIFVGGGAAIAARPGIDPTGLVAELNADGSKNTSFGTNGIATIDLNPGHPGVFGDIASLAETGGGKIIAGGSAGGFAAARIAPDGTLDSTFGNNGIQVVPSTTGAGRVLVDGTGIVYLIGGFGQATRLNSDGTPDPVFGQVFVDPNSDALFGSTYAAAGLIGGQLVVGGADFSSLLGMQGHSATVLLAWDTANGGDPSPITLSGRTLSVAGTSGDDLIRAQESSPVVSVSLNGFGRAFQISSVDTLNITGGDGNDRLFANELTTIPASISGGNGRDRISGTNVNDTLDGNGGRDFIDGGNGADHIFGGGGNDQLRGQGGADLIHGGPGNDYIEGDGGNDRLDGGSGHDTLFGNSGNDQFTSDDMQSDILDGRSGFDSAVVDSLDVVSGMDSVHTSA